MKESIRIRTSLRFGEPGGMPHTVGYPFASLDIADNVLTFSSATWLPFSSARWSVRACDVTELQRVPRGVRFFAEGRAMPWVIATPRTNSLLAALATVGLRPDGPIRPGTWTSI